MGFNTQLAQAALEAEANALADLFRGGWLDLMTGDQPFRGDDPIQNQLVLVSLQFGDPAFKLAVGGVIVTYPNSIIPGIAINTGDSRWFRTFKSNHSTSILDGSVGIQGSGSNCEVPEDNIRIYAGDHISIDVFIHDISRATLGS
jgi:hypothetical protein